MTHWNRFSAFHSRSVQNAVRGPLMNMDDDKGERGVVFMRWKERFLVPDHRVKDINGASFAGESSSNSDARKPTVSLIGDRILLCLRRV